MSNPWSEVTHRELTELAEKHGIAGAVGGRVFADVRADMMRRDPTGLWLQKPSKLDEIKIGTVLVHPDGPGFVIGETLSSWKLQRNGREILIAKQTMRARGRDQGGHWGTRYKTAARDDDDRECGDMRRKIEGSLHSATNETLRKILCMLG